MATGLAQLEQFFFHPNRNIHFLKALALRLKPVMENDACVEQKSGENCGVDPVKMPASTAPYRYSKVGKSVASIIAEV